MFFNVDPKKRQLYPAWSPLQTFLRLYSAAPKQEYVFFDSEFAHCEWKRSGKRSVSEVYPFQNSN